MNATARERTMIIGGGIGGLALAVGLGRVGIPAAVFERAPALVEVGAGLTLWSNAIKALRRLGLDEAVVARGSIIERAVTLTTEEELLQELDIAALCREAGAPTICVHRADLQQVLAEALEPGQLQLNATCVRFEQDAAGVTVHFADGRMERGAVLIGADGIHSVVREQLFGKEKPRYHGYFAYRGIAPCPPALPGGTFVFGLGRGTQLGIGRCGGDRAYWFATINAPAGRAPQLAGMKQPLLDAFRGWFPLVETVLESTEEAALLCNDIIDRPPRWPWGQGRVTLLGDAGHPTTPNLGQGACQALEDAVVLADLLRRQGLEADALRAYEEKRRKRTAMVTRQSRRLGKIFQWQSRPAVWLRRVALRSGLGQSRQDRFFRTLLQYEFPDLPSA